MKGRKYAAHFDGKVEKLITYESPVKGRIAYALPLRISVSCFLLVRVPDTT